MTAQRPVTTRQAARVIVLDRDDRILLMHARYLGRQFWITPGGGLKDGEGYEAAAIRELWEETGINAVPGLPCVWTRSHLFEFGDTMLDQRERFFLLRLQETPDISYVNWETEERNDLLGHRWWRVREIEVSHEVFGPRRLAELLRLLLREVPAEPVEVGL